MIGIGALVAIGGWLFLLGGVSISSGGMQVANLHLISIANNVIMLGYFLVVVGVIKAGIAQLSGSPVAAEPKKRRSFAEDMQARKDGKVTEADYLKQLADAKVFEKER